MSSSMRGARKPEKKRKMRPRDHHAGRIPAVAPAIPKYEATRPVNAPAAYSLSIASVNLSCWALRLRREKVRFCPILYLFIERCFFICSAIAVQRTHNAAVRKCKNERSFAITKVDFNRVFTAFDEAIIVAYNW